MSTVPPLGLMWISCFGRASSCRSPPRRGCSWWGPPAWFGFVAGMGRQLHLNPDGRMKLHPFRVQITLSRVPYGTQAALLLFWHIALLQAPGQGTFVYDQQSSTTEGFFPPASGAGIQQYAPVGQSFTPSLSAVGFIRLELADENPGNGLGGMLFVNLRMSGISGAILSTAAPVFLPDGYNGPANFFFGAPVAVTPGVTYYFDVAALSGDQWALQLTGGEPGLGYTGGTAFSAAGQTRSTVCGFVKASSHRSLPRLGCSCWGPPGSFGIAGRMGRRQQ